MRTTPAALGRTAGFILAVVGLITGLEDPPFWLVLLLVLSAVLFGGGEIWGLVGRYMRKSRASRLIKLCEAGKAQQQAVGSMGPPFWTGSQANLDSLQKELKRYQVWESEGASYVAKHLGTVKSYLFGSPTGLPESSPPFTNPTDAPVSPFQGLIHLWVAIDVRVKRLELYAQELESGG